MFGFKISRTPRPKFRIGLALSGGGARGFAHLGAIKALDGVGLKPDITAGVSAGSVVATMYSAGIRPDEVFEKFSSAKFSDFCEFNVPRTGFFNLGRFRKFIEDNVPYRNIEDLPVPTVVCATNYDTGRPVAFTKGNLAERVVASCSIPIVFDPMVIDGVRYVDGGLLHNLPAWAIRNKCRFLIGVNCSPLAPPPEKKGIVSVALRSYELVTKTNALGDMALCDMIVRTDDIARYKVFDLKGIEDVYESGYRDTLNFLKKHGIRSRD